MNLARKERLAVRDEPTGARDTRDPNHIWLRQSVTFTVNGQTRTLELALPLRPGATPEEVEALLDEADAGMRRLSRRLDAHLAEVTGVTPASVTPASATPAPPEPIAAPAATPEAPAAAPQPARRAARSHTPHRDHTCACRHARPCARHACAATRQWGTRPDTSGVPGGGWRAGPRCAHGDGAAERALAQRPQPARGARTAAPSGLARGRRPADAAPTPAAMPASMPDERDLPAPIGSARFDEEDDDDPDFELSYPDPDDLPGDDDFSGEDDFAPLEAAPARPAPSAASTGPLGDVPDLDDLLTDQQRAPVAPSAPATPATPATAHAREVIAALRVAHPGGQPIEQQRRAYQNIVLGQLGEAKVASVVRAVWGITPDRLGPEQFDAFNRWGKEDAFVEEVEDVLSLLRAEWIAQQAQQTQQAGAQPAASAAKPAAPPQRPAQRDETAAEQVAEQAAEQEPAARPAPRGRPATPRANTGATRGARNPQGGA